MHQSKAAEGSLSTLLGSSRATRRTLSACSARSHPQQSQRRRKPCIVPVQSLPQTRLLLMSIFRVRATERWSEERRRAHTEDAAGTRLDRHDRISAADLSVVREIDGNAWLNRARWKGVSVQSRPPGRCQLDTDASGLPSCKALEHKNHDSRVFAVFTRLVEKYPGSAASSGRPVRVYEHLSLFKSLSDGDNPAHRLVRHCVRACGLLARWDMLRSWSSWQMARA